MTPDAVIVGAGPNGLAAAIELARAGLSVQVIEANETIGGGCRTVESTLPGFRHDACSAVHPMAAASPFLRVLRLERDGVRWVHPHVPLAHPLDDGAAVVLQRSVHDTASGLGSDGGPYERFMQPLVDHAERLLEDVFALTPLRVPRSPMALARFGLSALRSASGLASRFPGDRGRALVAGIAAHSAMPLDRAPTAGFVLVLGMLGHLVGWPFAGGGSQAIVDAMASRLGELGGTIETGRRVAGMEELPEARALVLDLTPRQVLEVAGSRFPAWYRVGLARYRYGPGAFKVDWALDGPIPWRDERCLTAGTVHLGGTFEEIAASERAVWRDQHPERPFVLLAQPTLFDPTRAPPGRHTVWAYCHVPHGSTVDMTERIESQVERFAPGFRDRILARSVLPPSELQRHNQNYVGGDIAGGVLDVGQLLTRPVVTLSPHSTPDPRVFLCSSSTPPGPGVHGMCGLLAARAVVRGLRWRRASRSQPAGPERSDSAVDPPSPT